MPAVLLVPHHTGGVGWWGRGVTVTTPSLKKKCRWSPGAVHYHSLP